jgi:hypothetical protein
MRSRSRGAIRARVMPTLSSKTIAALDLFRLTRRWDRVLSRSLRRTNEMQVYRRHCEE